MTILDAMDGFLASLAVGHAPRTVTTYATALNRFRAYLEQAGIDPAGSPPEVLTVAQATDFVLWLTGEHFRDQAPAKSTLRTYLTAIARFFAFLTREQYLDLPAGDLQRLRDTYDEFRRGRIQRLPRPAAADVIEAMIQTARAMQAEPDDPRSELRRLRRIAVLETLRSTGIRVGELTRLRRGDLDYPSRSARVLGKGDKERIVWFDRPAWAAIQAYLQARQDGARGAALHQLPLFAQHGRGAGPAIKPITTNTVREDFNTVAAAAGIEQPVTPHTFRHAFATRALETTGDLAVVQDLLGHASPTTTRIYATVSGKRLRDAHRAMWGETE